MLPVTALVPSLAGDSLGLTIPRVTKRKVSSIKMLLVAAVGAFMGACGNDESPGEVAITTESPPSTALSIATVTPTMVPPSPTPVPYVSVEVIWFNADPEARAMRFVAVIHNSSSQVIEGLQTNWEVFDARGTSVDEPMPGKMAALPPGDSYFTGAMLNLARIPASVTVTITDPGRLTSGESSRLTVGEVAFQPTLLKNQYKVTASITTGSAPLEPTRLLLTAVGIDKAGKVVGVNFGFPSLPATIPPNTTIRGSLLLLTPDGVPVKVDVEAQVNLEPAHTEFNIVPR